MVVASPFQFVSLFRRQLKFYLLWHINHLPKPMIPKLFLLGRCAG
jgi:hypothetical protein